MGLKRAFLLLRLVGLNRAFLFLAESKSASLDTEVRGGMREGGAVGSKREGGMEVVEPCIVKALL